MLSSPRLLARRPRYCQQNVVVKAIVSMFGQWTGLHNVPHCLWLISDHMSIYLMSQFACCANYQHVDLASCCNDDRDNWRLITVVNAMWRCSSVELCVACLFASNGSTCIVRHEPMTAAPMKGCTLLNLRHNSSMLPRSSRAKLTKSQYSSCC